MMFFACGDWMNVNDGHNGFCVGCCHFIGFWFLVCWLELSYNSTRTIIRSAKFVLDSFILIVRISSFFGSSKEIIIAFRNLKQSIQ
jgi:hypothetical protein